MPAGTPIERSLICMLRDGTLVIDWGDGKAQDLMSGEFLAVKDKDFSHPATEADLNRLMHAGRLAAYDQAMVYLSALPEFDRKLLD